jgi:hypothetical protein
MTDNDVTYHLCKGTVDEWSRNANGTFTYWSRPCQRRLTESDYCWQHREQEDSGNPAMQGVLQQTQTERDSWEAKHAIAEAEIERLQTELAQARAEREAKKDWGRHFGSRLYVEGLVSDNEALERERDQLRAENQALRGVVEAVNQLIELEIIDKYQPESHWLVTSLAAVDGQAQPREAQSRNG